MRSDLDPAETDLTDLADLNSSLREEGQRTAQPGSTAPQQKQSRIISMVLSPAIRLLLRTQLERAEDLTFSIEAGDRQLLAGNISQVAVSARKAVYKGLCFSQIQVIGQNIRTNLSQVIRRRQALKLLEPFPISGEVLWLQADLNASLQAPLLAQGILEFLLPLLKLGLEGDCDMAQRSPREVNLQIPRIVLEPGQLTLSATLTAANTRPVPVVFRSGFSVENGNRLRLCHPERLPYLSAEKSTPLPQLDGVIFELGSDVRIEDLQLEAGQLRCRGSLTVTPE